MEGKEGVDYETSSAISRQDGFIRVIVGLHDIERGYMLIDYADGSPWRKMGIHNKRVGDMLHVGTPRSPHV